MAGEADDLMKEILSTLTELDRELSSLSTSTSSTASELKYYRTVYGDSFKPVLAETENRLKNLPVALIEKIAEEKPQFKNSLALPLALPENVKLLNEEAFEQIVTFCSGCQIFFNTSF